MAYVKRARCRLLAEIERAAEVAKKAGWLKHSGAVSLSNYRAESLEYSSEMGTAVHSILPIAAACAATQNVLILADFRGSSDNLDRFRDGWWASPKRFSSTGISRS